MAEELKQGDTAIYRGIMVPRHGQKVKVGPTMDGLVSVTFPDQRIIGVVPKALTKIEEQ